MESEQIFKRTEDGDSIPIQTLGHQNNLDKKETVPESDQAEEKLSVLQPPKDSLEESNINKSGLLSKIIKKLPRKAIRRQYRKKVNELGIHPGKRANIISSIDTRINENNIVTLGCDNIKSFEPGDSPLIQSNEGKGCLIDKDCVKNSGEMTFTQIDCGEKVCELQYQEECTIQMTKTVAGSQEDTENTTSQIGVLKNENQKGIEPDFDIKRVWFDGGRKDILFEICLDKEDDERRAIISRREMAKQNQPLLLSFYEKCLDYSKWPNASGFKLKQPPLGSHQFLPE